jgi:hypothetical protein
VALYLQRPLIHPTNTFSTLLNRSHTDSQLPPNFQGNLPLLVKQYRPRRQGLIHACSTTGQHSLSRTVLTPPGRMSYPCYKIASPKTNCLQRCTKTMRIPSSYLFMTKACSRCLSVIMVVGMHIICCVVIWSHIQVSSLYHYLIINQNLARGSKHTDQNM